MVHIVQLLIAFAVGSLCIYGGVENGYLIAAWMFVVTYGLTVWLPGTFWRLRERAARRRDHTYDPPDIGL